MGKMINVTEELNKINELIKTNGKLSAKDRNAILVSEANSLLHA